MRTNKLFKSVVSVLIVSTLIIVLALSCFGAEVSVTDSTLYWTSGQWTWYYYDQHSGFFSTDTFASTVDWANAFPDNALVVNGYVPSFSSVGLLLNDASLSNAAPAYNVNVQYARELHFLSGVTYGFFMRVDSIIASNSSAGSRIPFTLGDVSLSLRDSSNASIGVWGRSRSILIGYGDCFYFSFTPSADISASSFRFTITNSSYSPSMPYAIDNLDISLSLSSFVSYTGDIDAVVVNPKLDDIDKQLDDIKNAVGDIKGNPDDTAPGLDGLESEGQAANDALDDLLHGIDVPDGKEHWTKAMELFSDINLLAAFQWWGLCFDYVSAHALLSYLSLFSCLIMLICSVFGLYRSAVFRLNYENKNAEKEVTSTYHSTVRRGTSRVYSTHDRVRVTRYNHGRAVSVRDSVHTDLHED